MKLVYYKKTVPNFGDDLNEVLWPALEPGLFDDDGEQAFIGIGTIIGMKLPGFRKLHVFSSGAGNDDLSQWSGHDVNFVAVRGPMSAHACKIDPRIGCTDGAILSPMVWSFPATSPVAGEIVIVPHWETLEHPGWNEVAALTGYKIIDPRRPPLEVIRELATAKLVLTESLHGAILADTYGVPWIPFVTNKNFAFGKWVDWTMSVGLPCELWMVPPPDATAVIRFGKVPAPYDTMQRYDSESAAQDMQKRMRAGHSGRTSPVRKLKDLVKQSPFYQASLKLTPSRTAQSLTKLAQSASYLSEERVRQSRADDLRSRLAKLAQRLT